MIFNIPVQVDEVKMEEVIARDYEGKVLAEITAQVKKTLANHAERYYGDKVGDGMRVLIESQINGFLKEYKDDIIDKAAVLLADKLARSKRGKEILNDISAKE